MAKPKPKRVNGNITLNVATPNGTLHVETARCYVVVLHQNMKLRKCMIMLLTIRLSSWVYWESVCPKMSSTKRDKSPLIYFTHCGKQWKDFSQCSVFRDQYNTIEPPLTLHVDRMAHRKGKAAFKKKKKKNIHAQADRIQVMLLVCSREQKYLRLNEYLHGRNKP